LPQVNTTSAGDSFNQPALPNSANDLDAGPPIQPYAQILPSGQIYFSWYNFHQTAFQSTVILINGKEIIYDGDGTSFVWTPDVSGNIVANFYTKLLDGRTNRLEIYTTIPVSAAAVPDQAKTSRNTPINNINVLQNDSSGGFGPMQVTWVGDLPPHVGLISINSDSTINFTPTNQMYLGPVQFSYEMSAGGYLLLSTVTVTVNQRSDDQPPVITFADSTTQTLTERTSVSLPFTLSDTYTPPEDLKQSLTWSSPEISCQITGTGSDRTLQITGNIPINGATATLTYTDWDQKISSVTFQIYVVPDPNLHVLSSPLYSSSASGNAFSFNINGYPATSWMIYSSVDLVNWTPVAGMNLVNGAGSYTDNTVGNSAYRFYKVSNGTYTSDVIGFERETVQSGNNLICNQFSEPASTLKALFGQMPDGSAVPNQTLVQIENASQQFINYTWDGFHWYDPSHVLADNVTLVPGQGAFIQNNSGNSFTVTFAGLVLDGQTSVTLAPGGSLAASPLPIRGGITSVLGYSPQDGDTLSKWDPTSQSLGIGYIYFDDPAIGPAGWYDESFNPVPEPVIGVGEGFEIQNNQTEIWTQTFVPSTTGDVPALSSATISGNTFTFLINGDAGTKWQVYSSPDLVHWTPAGPITLTGSTGIYGGSGSYTDNNVNGLAGFYKLSNGTYTSRVIGFEREIAQVGYAPIANQLIGPANSLHGLFGLMADGTTPVPSGTKVLIWDTSQQTFAYYTLTGSGWQNSLGNSADNVTLVPGQGAFIQNNSGNPFTVTFAGLVADGQTIATLAQSWNFVSSAFPLTGGITSVLGYNPQYGDIVEKYDPTSQSSIFSMYSDGSDGFPAGWYDGSYNPMPEPVINVGEGFEIQNGQSSPETWTQTFSDHP
jgi:hypothetical protein